MVRIPGTQISTSMVQVSAGSKTAIWGVDASNNIYQYTGSGSTWTQIPGGLKQVSVGVDGTVWGVNAAGNIYQYNGASPYYWTGVTGGLAQISVGDAGLIWGVNAAGNIYYYTGTGPSGWTGVTGGLKQVSVSSNNLLFGGPRQTIWGVNAAGNIYQYTGTGPSGWMGMPGSDQNDGGFANPGGAFAQVAVASSQAIYALDPAGNIFQYNPSNTTHPWHFTNYVAATSLSVAEDGTLVLIDTMGTTQMIAMI